MSGVTRHCSILNYIRQVDNDLYEIIQDLCIGRMFLPKKGMGLTFLRPDKGLMEELKKMIKAGKEEDALDAIRASLIRDHIEHLSELSTGGYQNALRRTVLDGKVDGSKFVFSNGAVAQMDSFQRRTDRENISCFLLSGKFLPTDTAEVSDEKKTAPRARSKKGGGDFGENRANLFNIILTKQVMHYPSRDFAKEVLVSLLEHVRKTAPTSLLLLQSQLSYDALTSLAIILQPNKASHTYVDGNLFTTWKSENKTDELMRADLYWCQKNPRDLYIKHMEEFDATHKDLRKQINDIRDKFAREANKINFVKDLNASYAEVAKCLADCKDLSPRADVNLMVAEAELRVMGASLLSDMRERIDYDNAVRVFTMHTLNGPYYLSDPRAPKAYNSAFWFSNPATIVNSDGYFYLPNLLDSGSISLHDFDYSKGGTILLAVEDQLGSDKVFNAYFEALQKMLGQTS